MNGVEECPIPESDQRRNGIVFLISNVMIYLIAPVTYVGVLHATILEALKASDTVANLPESVYMWVAPLPVLVAWIWPSPRLLRPMLIAAQVVKGAAGGAAALVFALAPPSWWIPVLLVHPAVIGITGGVQIMCLWELIGRGMGPVQRGRTLGWTYGIGPLFAVAGSCASQLILKGEFPGLPSIEPWKQPWSYVLLFGVSCPAMWFSAALVALARVPESTGTDSGASIREVARGLLSYLGNRMIMITAVGFLLTYGGTMIMNNLSLYAREALGEAPEHYAGLQLALRFGFKSVMGFTLGWLVTRLHPKASLLATTSICAAGIVWALLVPGKLYMLSFGLLGAGELFYVYYVNYVVGCSEPHRMRENTAYTNLVSVSIGFLPIAFGWISDEFGRRWSFVTALAILLTALAIVQLLLPKHPRPLPRNEQS